MSDELTGTFKLLGTPLKCSAPPRTKSENPSVHDNVPEPQEKSPLASDLQGLAGRMKCPGRRKIQFIASLTCEQGGRNTN